MEQSRYHEMISNLNMLKNDGFLANKEVFLFAHCNATLELADALMNMGICPRSILDNNPDKYSLEYKGISVCAPNAVVDIDNSTVLIVSRFYEQMAMQLRNMGFSGEIHKLIEYNSFSEYSLSPETIVEKKERVKRGVSELERFRGIYKEHFFIFCPFPAMGDVYLCMSYLPAFLKHKGKEKCVVFVVGHAQKQVAELFGGTKVECLPQKELDELIQAVIYINDDNSYIAHQDRPYVVDLHRALYIKCIPLEKIYKCGVFGLPQDTEPHIPKEWVEYKEPKSMIRGKSAILSPYAKSVPNFPIDMWKRLADDLKADGYTVFSNVVGDEPPIDGTVTISPKIAELKSAVEKAGLFIGIRSGVCDVIRTADCRKIALYPDYYYCDTKWKAIDMYALDGFENIVVKEDYRWKKS